MRVAIYGCLLRRAAELLPKAAILICDEANSRTADMTVLHDLLKHMLIFMRFRRTAILMSVALDLHVITILCRCHAARSYDFCFYDQLSSAWCSVEEINARFRLLFRDHKIRISRLSSHFSSRH